MEHFQVILRMLNAALEHCSPVTKGILMEAAQPHIDALGAKLEAAAAATAIQPVKAVTT